MSTMPTGLPGVTTRSGTSPRNVMLGGLELLPGGKIIDGAKSRDPGNTGDLDVLRAGTLMGKITSGGKYAPSIMGVTTNAEAIGSTSIQAAAAVVTELVRRVGATGTFKLTGPATAGGVVETETVTYSGTSGTDITVTALTKAFVAGSFIQPTDGSEEPLAFIEDHDGIKVTDQDDADVSVPFARVPIAGVVDASQLLPAWPSDTALQLWIMERFPRFTFDHEL